MRRRGETVVPAINNSRRNYMVTTTAAAYALTLVFWFDHDAGGMLPAIRMHFPPEFASARECQLAARRYMQAPASSATDPGTIAVLREGLTLPGGEARPLWLYVANCERATDAPPIGGAAIRSERILIGLPFRRGDDMPADAVPWRFGSRLFLSGGAK
jgi:hypothetical protein